MKKLLMVIAFAVVSSGAIAQSAKSKPKAQSQPVVKEAMDDQVASNDGYARIGGSMVILKGGETRPLENDQIQFENGNYLTRDGVLVFNNGNEKIMVEEGMKVDMKGNLVREAKPTPAKAE